ncbi:unnamed protein product [Penicillium salamii]|uniref:MIT domain-containing protein n=1 Tax=Penicillium salamii TaxID=1612424 RepID=A0A9W4ICD0_9EURO|nr:unnamed protein product [Penicillium salamii]CAG8256787.1 unnamed protein product [Penicillium salamii]CAG8280592.1 unnamed protein product [Penicillium salamii]CAG8299106.1 unnamed protein product [Penicillium salamii]CAG8391351.1 unnamed protein product [Penicillium salamii]
MTETADAKNQLYKLAALPFILERKGDYDDAIRTYKTAIEILDELIKKFKKGRDVRKVNRKMFERQVQVHRERLAYLEGLKRKGIFENVILPPTILDAMEELEAENGKTWNLTQIRKALHDFRGDGPRDAPPDLSAAPAHIHPFLGTSSAEIPFFSPTLSLSLPPITYRITHSSELVDLGMRSYWFFVKDVTNTHVLYALQFIWSNEAPIVETVLRRAGEFLPGIGATSVNLQRMKGGSFRLITRTIPDMGAITEIPDGEMQRKDWSPRRFEYGGRNFVWKSAAAEGKKGDGGLFGSFGFAWETLYETKRVWAKEGSRTGKKEDEVAGPRLCWGEKKGGNGADHSIHMVGGLDLYFREHLLAVQLSRLARVTYPPQKDTTGVEAAAAGVGWLSIVTSLA